MTDSARLQQVREAALSGRLARFTRPLQRMATVNRGANLATLRFARRHGLTVLDGPFAGLRYPRSALVHVGGLVTRLAGSYEAELHPVVEEMIALDPAMVVNIGAGEGYYAVGMARRLEAAKIVAYEADPYTARAFRELVAVNDVAARVSLRGTCTAKELAGLDPPAGTVVLCDVEGGEVELIDPAVVGWLRTSPIVVELHLPIPGLEEAVRDALAPTHDLETVTAEPRYLQDYPPFWDLRGVSPSQAEMLLAELRPWRTPWLVARPRAAG